MIEDLKLNTRELSEEDFTYAVDESFVTLLSNGQEVELVPGGATRKVSKANLDEYIKAIVQTRLHESAKQVKAIKEGIDYVIPLNILKLLDWKMVEIRATGSKSLDIEKLKSIT
jgi:hypothetical protein